MKNLAAALACLILAPAAAHAEAIPPEWLEAEYANCIQEATAGGQGNPETARGFCRCVVERFAATMDRAQFEAASEAWHALVDRNASSAELTQADNGVSRAISHCAERLEQ